MSLKYKPGDVIPHLNFVDKENPRVVRRAFHRGAFVWVHSVTENEHYVMQCEEALDKHRVLAVYFSEDLAYLARSSIERLVKSASEPETEETKGIKQLAAEAGLRVRS